MSNYRISVLYIFSASYTITTNQTSGVHKVKKHRTRTRTRTLTTKYA